MSGYRTTTTFTEVENITIECCNKQELEDLSKNIILDLDQKLEKLNILIKNTDVYSYNGCLLVQDRYNICKDIKDICVSFGLNISQIQSSLRGKTYVISDDLVGFLKQIDVNYNFGNKVQNKTLTEDIKSIILENSKNYTIDDDIISMVRNIKKNGAYSTKRSRKITTDYEDYTVIGVDVGDWVSDVDEVKEKLLNLSKTAQDKLKNANSQLRDGTAKLIYSRARQMGYSVQEVKKGTQTQLVLVRCE